MVLVLRLISDNGSSRDFPDFIVSEVLFMDENQSRTIGEVISQMLEESIRLGFEKTYVWGTLGRSMKRIHSYYRKKRRIIYDIETTCECLEFYKARVERHENSAFYVEQIEVAVRRLNEFYLTGTIGINNNRVRSRIILSSSFEKLLDLFVADMGYGENTVNDAIWVVKKYLNYFSALNHNSLETVSLEDVRSFIMKTALSVKSSTLHDIFLYLRQFHAFLKKAGIAAPNAEPLFSNTIHREMPIQGHVTNEELKKIISVIDTSTESGCRNLAIIQLAATTGIRACDVIRLKLTDIDWRTGELHIVQEKTEKEVFLPLMPDAGQAIQNYILNFRPMNTGCKEVFLRCAPPKIAITDASTIGTMFREYQHKAGINRKAFDGKGFHGIRRNLAKGLLGTGTPPETIAQILGHTQVESVQQYMVLNIPALKECAADFTGIAVERREFL